MHIMRSNILLISWAEHRRSEFKYLFYATNIIIQVSNMLSQPQQEKTHGHLVPFVVHSYNVHYYLLSKKKTQQHHTLT